MYAEIAYTQMIYILEILYIMQATSTKLLSAYNQREEKNVYETLN